MGDGLDAVAIRSSFALCEGLSFPRGDAVVDTDMAYGPHERHRLDIYRPAHGEEARPLLLFVHGGGYASGDKAMGIFFATLGHWAATHGLACATINYRLAPDHGWPCVQQDISRAISWLGENAAGYGFDADRIKALCDAGAVFPGIREEAKDGVL